MILDFIQNILKVADFSTKYCKCRWQLFPGLIQKSQTQPEVSNFNPISANLNLASNLLVWLGKIATLW